MRVLLIILGLACLALAIVYWVIPADQLPNFVPGFEAGLSRTRIKHGAAAAVVAVVLFGLGWYAGRARA